MQIFSYTREQLISVAKFSGHDLEEIKNCRQDYNRLGFGYQLACVRLLNRLPTGHPLEVIDDILVYVTTQLDIPSQNIRLYAKLQKTVFQHQERIRTYLSFRHFNMALTEIEDFLFKESFQLEQTATLTARLREFLRTNHILEAAQDTMLRTIQTQREAARTAIYDKVARALSDETRQCLDALLSSDDTTYSPLHYFKKPPGNPSPASFIKLTAILDQIKETGVLTMDMSWLNNNFQRSLARYAWECTIFQLRQLKEARRYTVLACFLNQLHQDTFDAAVQMHDKLMKKMYNKADKEIDDYMKTRRKNIRSSLSNYKEILGVLLDTDIKQEQIRESVFTVIDPETFKAEMVTIEELLSNQYSDSFKRVIARHSYMRQFSPSLTKHITFQADTQDKTSDDIIKAVNLLNRMNEEGKHKLPEDAPIGFIPKKLRPFVFQEDKPIKSAWECALLTVLRDQIKSGNLSVPNSKRFASLDYSGP